MHRTEDVLRTHWKHMSPMCCICTTGNHHSLVLNSSELCACGTSSDKHGSRHKHLSMTSLYLNPSSFKPSTSDCWTGPASHQNLAVLISGRMLKGVTVICTASHRPGATPLSFRQGCHAMKTQNWQSRAVGI